MTGGFAWQAFLAVARELGEMREHLAPLDARERAAISRAYYAVFGRALALFREFGEYTPQKSGDDHAGLARELSAARDHRRRRVGDILTQLRTARRWADYERAPEPARRDTIRVPSMAITQAAHALTLCDDIEQRP